MGIRTFAPHRAPAQPSAGSTSFSPRPFAGPAPRKAAPAILPPPLRAARTAVQPLRIKRVREIGKDTYERAEADDRDVIDTALVFSDGARNELIEDIKAKGNKGLALDVLLEWEGQKVKSEDLAGVRETIAALKGKKEDDDILATVVRLAQQLDRAEERLKSVDKEEERRALGLTIDGLRTSLAELQGGKFKVKVAAVQAPRPVIAITDAMRLAYRQDMLALGTWGGMDEGNHVASHYGFSCRVFTVIGGHLVLIQTIGNGAARGGRDLVHRGNHYEVIRNANDGDAFAAVAKVAATRPVGDCLFEALYIVQHGHAVPAGHRDAVIRRFRQIAVQGLTDPEVDASLTEILSQGLVGGVGSKLRNLLQIQDVGLDSIKARLDSLKTPATVEERGALSVLFKEVTRQREEIGAWKASKKTKPEQEDVELAAKVKAAEESLAELNAYMARLEREHGVKMAYGVLADDEQLAVLDMLRSLSKLVKGQQAEKKGKETQEEVQSILIDGTVVVTGNSMRSPGDFTDSIGSAAKWSSETLNTMYATAKESTKSKSYAKVEVDDLYKVKTGMNLLNKPGALDKRVRAEYLAKLETAKTGRPGALAGAEEGVAGIDTGELDIAYADSPAAAAENVGKARIVVLTPSDDGGWHAEQYLLVVVATLLKKGVVPRRVAVSGVKEPCSACLAVLQEQGLAFWEATKRHLIFDTRPVPKAKQKHMHDEDVRGKTLSHPIYKPDKVPNPYWKAFLEKLGIKPAESKPTD